MNKTRLALAVILVLGASVFVYPAQTITDVMILSGTETAGVFDKTGFDMSVLGSYTVTA